MKTLSEMLSLVTVALLVTTKLIVETFKKLKHLLGFPKGLTIVFCVLKIPILPKIDPQTCFSTLNMLIE